MWDASNSNSIRLQYLQRCLTVRELQLDAVVKHSSYPGDSYSAPVFIKNEQSYHGQLSCWPHLSMKASAFP